MARKAKARTSEKAPRARSTRRSSAKRTGSRRASRAQGSDVSDYPRQGRGGKLAQGKQGSCAPKLFMLLMPFAVLGTYLVLRS
jgi:hypothetical protein